MTSAYTPPATFVASACSGAATNVADVAPEATADCSQATTNGATCALTIPADYAGGRQAGVR